MWLMAIMCICGAYSIGAIPFGLLVGRLKGVDVRQHGSGNIGATNVGRVLGRNYGLAVFGLDMLKGLLPVLAAGRILPTAPDDPHRTMGMVLWVLVAMAGVLGHMFPVYVRFQGGKGVATSLGVLLGIYPFFTWPGLATFGVWALVTSATRYVSLGSVVAAGAFPLLFALFARLEGWDARYVWPLHVFAVLVAGLVIYRHRGNLKRLMAGTESRIGKPRPSASALQEQ